MQYVKTAGWEDGVAALTERLVRELAGGKKVLWLVTGGSNIKASIDIMKTVPTKASQRLNVLLADERYGAPGHPDSNWAQLMKAGFDTKQARALPILRKGDNFEQAKAYYEQIAQQAFSDAEIVIAQIGIGTDGHIVGILPGSVASKETTDLISAYESAPYKRLTMTFPALRKVNVNYSFAFGEPKRQALLNLQSKKLSPIKQPAQILKELPEVYIYSDQVGDSV